MLDEPRLCAVLDRSADPALARAQVERLVDAHPWLPGRLRADPLLAEALVAVVGASRSLFAALERDPAAVTMLEAATLRAEVDYRAEAAALLSGEDPPRALRRWKRRHVVRIAGRDLVGLADLRAVGDELARLADACLETALAIAAPAVPMCVVGMGKLGGDELNYASDVDVMFVHDGDTAAAEHAARSVLATMSRPGAEGIVFRTDADLRPEGRSGALSRTIEGYEQYWRRWARTWERQALIKARVVAGDGALGRRFSERAAAWLWQGPIDPDAVREVRAMKARTEELLDRKGIAEREVKRGPGGIRDVEFAVQLLQLVHGRHDETLRVRGTLDALERLAAGGYVTTADARRLDEAYVWLRTVEHRLQLVEERQTHTIPADPGARTHLARVLGFRDAGTTSAVDAFDAAHRTHKAAVRAVHEKLFFAPVLDAIAGAGTAALSVAAAEERLAAFGFRDVEQTRAALRELTAGLTRRSRVMQQLLPVVLEWLSTTPDPDLGLLQLRRLSEGYTRASTLARSFRETPAAAERTCRLLGSSRVLGAALHRQPEYVDTLADDAALGTGLRRDALVAEALDTLDWREDDRARRTGLRRFKRRQLLHVGARDLLGYADLSTVGRELSYVADACVEAALRSLEPDVPFAVIGLGRLGGLELSYASDIDVVFVYEGAGATAFEQAERIAARLVRAVGETTAEGRTFRVDTRLRPEGGQGVLARSVEGYVTYWERWAQVWELQALTKARFVAGDPGVAEAFLGHAARHVYRDPFAEDWRREIRRMKARIERERIPPGEDPRFHLKLGRGSLSDVEFTVQLAQLEHGAAHPSVRATPTLAALHELVTVGAIDAQDAAALHDAFVLCERARNYRYLLTGTPGDSLPVDGDEARRLGRMLGYVHDPQQTLRDEYRRVTRRARAVVERVFYGRAP
ncbi:MAG: glutamate-ammonia-ligase adenylyltransferase [Acidimicrobiia bacterium]|nr:MAG: glutamate-ammonia-ligase adenylyltransferase [Acidimicrobiia bacterium]